MKKTIFLFCLSAVMLLQAADSLKVRKTDGTFVKCAVDATSSLTITDPGTAKLKIRKKDGTLVYFNLSDVYNFAFLKSDAPASLSGNISVGIGETYTSLTRADGLFAAINSGSVTGHLTVNITSDLTNEDGAVTLNQWTGSYNMLIIPSGGARIISGSAGNNAALIQFSGADVVAINGTDSKLLTIINNNANAGDAGAVIGLNNGSENCFIKNCTISNTNANSTTVTGILIGRADGITISKNRIYQLNGTSSAAVTGIKYTGDATAMTANISNNMISLIPTTTGIVTGMQYSGNSLNSLNLYYNSIYLGGTQSGTANSYAFLKESAAANMDISDNIFYNSRTNSAKAGSGSHYAVGLTDIAGTITEDYNMLYSADTKVGVLGAADKSTLQNWKDDTPYDENSQSNTLFFVDETNGDLRYQRIPGNINLFNTGTTVATISEDYYGNARSFPLDPTPDIGAYEMPFGSGLSENAIPFTTSLSQNYPNPFNPETVINYQLRIADNTKLAVYNAKGELVQTLINGMQEPGKYSVNFNGTGFNSGVYFYKLESDGKTLIKKMIMIK